MTKILLIFRSPRGTASLSARFALELTERLRSCGIGTSLLVRDLADPPLPHVDVSYINGRTRNADERSRAETQAVELAEALIGELQLADIVIIASSMVNFSVSSVLKTWFDYLIWPGITIKYTNRGFEGLITEKKVFFVAAADSIYLDSGLTAHDFQMTYLRHVLNFLGLQDLKEIRIERITSGPVGAQVAMDKASAVINNLVGTIAQQL